MAEQDGPPHLDIAGAPSTPVRKRKFGNNPNEISETVGFPQSNRADDSTETKKALPPCENTPCTAPETRRLIQHRLAGYELQPCTAPEIRNIVQQKEVWGGWAVTANEGDIFEHILHRVDCKSIVVNDVLCYDDENMRNLKECYGVLFLMPFNADYETQDGEKLEDLPEKLWFANQVAENACGSYGLLNIVMNLPHNVELGQQLQNFKEFSQNMHPKLRGECVASFKTLKDAHNSFCARYEMEDCDYDLYDRATKQLKQRRPTKAQQVRLEEEESANPLDKPFHYIAYVRSGGYLWELDGLKPTPFKVNPCNDANFTTSIGARLRELTSRFPNQHYNFSALSLTAINMPHLTQERNNTAHKLGAIDNVLMKRDPTFSRVVERDLLNSTYTSKAPSDLGLDLDPIVTKELLDLRLALITRQREIDDALTEARQEADRRVWSVARKQHDYEPFILEMARMGVDQYLAGRGKAKTTPRSKGKKDAKPKARGKAKR